MKKIFLLLFAIIIVSITIGLYFISTSGDSIKKVSEYITNKYVKELAIDYSKIDLSIEDSSLFKREITFTSKAQCIEYSRTKVCLENLDLDFNINILSPLEIEIKKMNINISKGELGKTEKKSEELPQVNIYSLYQQVYALYSKINKRLPQEVNVKIKNFTIDEGTDVEFLANKDVIFLRMNSPILSVELDLDQKSDKSFSGMLKVKKDDFKVNSKITLHLKENILLTLNPKVTLDDFEIDSTIKLSFQENFNLQVQKTAIKLPQAVVKLDSCHFEVTESPQHNFICPDIMLVVSNEKLISLKVDSYLKNTIDFKKTDQAIKMSVKSFGEQKELFELDFKAKASVDIVEGSLNPNINEFRWDLRFQKFQKLVKRLEETSFAIFAPFNTMEGKVHLKSEKMLDLNKNGYNIPLVAQIDLSDKKKNAIKLNFEGNFQARNKLKPILKGNLSLDEVVVNVPKIDPIGGIPNLSGSSRVQKKIQRPNTKSKETPLIYDISVTTTSSQSIRIYYYLLKPYLAFGLNAQVNNEFTTVKVQGSKKVTISYLKRELFLNSFVVENKKNEKTEININSSYFTSGYKINLKIIGTLEKPKLILSSYPTLPREDILSLLIFKRKANAISGSQRQSVGGTEAAIADRALGLFSIWAFASTPIEYVAYDPSSKSYTASISLPGNTSFKIGTNWETVSALTLRKQLSETWAIETSYNPNDEEKSKNLMLQKEINF